MSIENDLSPRITKTILWTTLIVQLVIMVGLYWFYLRYLNHFLGEGLLLLSIIVLVWQWHRRCQKMFLSVICSHCQKPFFKNIKQLFGKLRCCYCDKTP